MRPLKTKKVYSHPELTSVMVVDDDVLFDCDFNGNLKSLLADNRCGAVTQPDGPASILLLGTAIWIPGRYPRNSVFCGGWRLFDDTIRVHKEHTGTQSMCVNVNSRNYGTFAVIYHRNSIPVILEWIKNAKEPFDHMFYDLSLKQVFVRAAYPFLAIQDVRHASQIDPTRHQQEDMQERALKHRWDLDRVCDMQGKPLNQSLGGDPDTKSS